MRPDAEILFVGAKGRMEMTRVPEAGYDIKGLPIAGFNRKNPFANIKVLFKIFKSQQMAKKIIKTFQPQAVVGVGGYASGPTLKMAAKMGIPTLIQEQNSYAGVTNKLLAKSAHKICVAYDGMERFFPKDKILKTGNPVRQSLLSENINVLKGIKGIGLKSAQRMILELKDKIVKGEGASSEVLFQAESNANVEEATSALVILGYNKQNIQKAIQKILKANPNASVEQLIRSALQML